MRVLYISQSSHLYGSGRALYNILSGLQRGKEVQSIVVLPDDKGELYRSLIQIGITPVILPISAWVYPPYNTFRDKIAYLYRLFRILLQSLKAFIELSKIIKEIKPDIIHTNVGVIHIGYLVAKRYHIRHIWHIREFQDLHFGWTPIPSNKSFIRKLHSRENFSVSISKALFSHYELGANAKVIYDGVFDETDIPNQVNEKKNYFLYVGNIYEGKGVREAVEGFLSFSKSYHGYEFWLAGEGALMQWLNNIAETEPSIKPLGYRNDINYLMQGAMALIVPSRFEGFGFISVEAMLNYCLVIGHNVAGIKEQFDNGLEFTGKEIGLRYEGINGLVSAMQSVVMKPENDFKEMTDCAYKTVREYYSIQKDTQELLTLYKILLNK